MPKDRPTYGGVPRSIQDEVASRRREQEEPAAPPPPRPDLEARVKALEVEVEKLKKALKK